MGGCCLFIPGGKLNNKKMKIESNGALGLDGCHRMGGHNNIALLLSHLPYKL